MSHKIRLHDGAQKHFCNGADILTVTIYNDPPPLQDGPPQTCRRQASGPRCMSQNKNTRKGSIPPSAINRRMMIVIITNTEVIPPIPSPAWGVCGLFAPVRAGAGGRFLIPARPREVCTLPIPAARPGPACAAPVPARPGDGGGFPVPRAGAGGCAALPGAGGTWENAWYSQFLSFAGWRSFK